MRSVQILSKKKGVYKFVHELDEYVKLNIELEFFESEFLRIEKDGVIRCLGTSKEGYAWDGCSPKFIIWDFTIGTPDGRLDLGTKKPITYFASMFHDVLYQNRRYIDLSRKDVDELFYEILKAAGFRWARLYFWVVRIAGWWFGEWKTKHSQQFIRISDKSWRSESEIL